MGVHSQNITTCVKVDLLRSTDEVRGAGGQVRQGQVARATLAATEHVEETEPGNQRLSAHLYSNSS